MTVTHPETHTKRQATQHGCLTSLMGDGDKGIEILYSEEKVIFSEPTRAAKTKINLQGPLLLYSIEKHFENSKTLRCTYLILELFIFIPIFEFYHVAQSVSVLIWAWICIITPPIEVTKTSVYTVLHRFSSVMVTCLPTTVWPRLLVKREIAKSRAWIETEAR